MRLYHEMLETSAAPAGRYRRLPFPVPLTPDGQLDRRKLGQEVFSHKDRLEQLNEHRLPPSGAGGAAAAGGRRTSRLCAIDAINLLEGGLDQLCDRTVAVTSPLELRVRRIMARDNIPEQYARLRISAQKPDEYYRSKCDCELNNAADTAAAFETGGPGVFPAADRNHQGGKSTWKRVSTRQLKEQLLSRRSNGFDRLDGAERERHGGVLRRTTRPFWTPARPSGSARRR